MVDVLFYIMLSANHHFFIPLDIVGFQRTNNNELDSLFIAELSVMWNWRILQRKNLHSSSTKLLSQKGSILIKKPFKVNDIIIFY